MASFLLGVRGWRDAGNKGKGEGKSISKTHRRWERTGRWQAEGGDGEGGFRKSLAQKEDGGCFRLVSSRLSEARQESLGEGWDLGFLGEVRK